MPRSEMIPSVWFDKSDASQSFEHYMTSISYLGSEKRFRKFAELRRYLSGQRYETLRAAVIGPGSDIEISTLLSLYLEGQIALRLEIHCFDLSERVLKYLRGNEHPSVSLEFVLADAVALPCRDNWFDLVISSSLEHEVYSYRGGVLATEASIREYCRVLADGGVLFLRDFSPPLHRLYALRLDTRFAKAFWDEFSLQFRKRYGERLTYTAREGLIMLDSYEAIDFVTHLAVKILYDSAYENIGTWKEINERYIVLPQEWYIREITEKWGLRLVRSSSDREVEQEEVVDEHVTIFQVSSDGSLKRIPPVCERFNLIFQKND